MTDDLARDLIAKTLKLKATKSLISRRRRDNERKQGVGDDNHLTVGPAGSGDTEYRYRSFIRFDFGNAALTDEKVSDVGKVLKAELVVQAETDSSKHYAWGDKPRVAIRDLTERFTESTHNGEANWGTDDYEWPSTSTKDIVVQDVVEQDNKLIYFDISKAVGKYLPTRVVDPTGANGKGNTHYGYALETDDEWANNQRCVFFSDNHPTEDKHPYILLTYEPINHGPSAPVLDVLHPPEMPTGTTFADAFEGQHVDPDGDDMVRRKINVYLPKGATVVWPFPAALEPASSEEVATGRFSVPLMLGLASLKSQTDYEWTAQTMDSTGKWGPEAPRRGFKITSRPPAVVAKSLGSVASLSGLKFGGSYSDPENNAMSSYQVQLRPTLAANDPSWDDGDDLWDTGEAKPTADQVTRKVIEAPYAGAKLVKGGYSFRVRAKDSTGVWSAWSYATVTLTADYAPAWNVLDLTTGIDRDAPVRIALYAIARNKWQVTTVSTGGTWSLTGNGKTVTFPYAQSDADKTTMLKTVWPNAKITVTHTYTSATNTRVYTIEITQDQEVGTVTASGANLTGDKHSLSIVPKFTRGPGKLIGYVEDPINLGASKFLNSGGELYFTLPATHPYCEVIEPYNVHYSVEQWYGDRFRPIFDGLITDFDATPDEAVFYGIDYLGLYQLCVDDRYIAAKGVDHPADMSGGGGSKYVDRTIDAVIKDQLLYHQKQASSLVNFINIGAISAMVERVTIFSTYTEALPFIAGLLDSHKQGTGKEAQLQVRRRAQGGFEVVVLDNIGTDRPNIRLEYGGLLNDFRVVGLGDFGTRVLGVGTTRGGSKPLHAIGTSSPALDEARWGRIAKTRVFQELIDENDLKRRVNEAASQIGKVGKRMALAIRSDALVPFDGWDLGDNIKVDIDRGVVDSSRYGSGGYWEVLGTEFRYYSDGHSDLSLTILPKKTSGAANPDLIPSRNPGMQKEWQVGVGAATVYGFPPTPVTPVGGAKAATGNPWSSAFSSAFGMTPDGIPDFDQEPVVATHYLDLETGCVYEIQPDLTYLNVFCPADVIPPGAGQDTEAPPAPEVHGLRTTLFKQENGTYVVAIIATVGYPPPADPHDPPTFTDLDYYLTETTSATIDNDGVTPDWTVTLERTGFSADNTGRTDVEIIITPLQAATRYWVRAAAVDTSGNFSQVSDEMEIVSAADNEAPPQVTGAVVAAGVNSFGLRWDSVEVEDLRRYEVRYRELPGGAWVYAYIRGTLIVVTDLVNGTTYDVQIRSVDTSGNTLHDTGVDDGQGNPIYESVKAAAEPEKGWVSVGQVTPSAQAGDTLIWDDAMIENLFGGKIRADWITGGTLTVGGGIDPVALTVVNANGDTIGTWDGNGMSVFDPSNGQYKMTISDSSLIVWSVADPGNPFKIVEIGPRGINAASITFGSQRGGHNLVRNSSFELGAFAVSVAENVQWDVAADWTGTVQGTPTNTITGAGSLTMSPT